jgi:SAM-dependent methyltransferase
MFEQTKSSIRRSKISKFQNEIFSGEGIDIGSGNDSLKKNMHLFPKITNIRCWDMPDGDAQYLASINDNTFDFIHSSHCLEHMVDPHAAMTNWLRVCKVGGYLILTVPDETLYEHDMWPSRFNTDHKWSFRLSKTSNLPKSIYVPDFISQFKGVNLIDCTLIDAGVNYALDKNMDQTLLPNVECAIEIILKKY